MSMEAFSTFVATILVPFAIGCIGGYLTGRADGAKAERKRAARQMKMPLGVRNRSDRTILSL